MISFHAIATLQDAGEFANIYNGLLPRPASYNSTNLFKKTGVKVAATVDWREKGAVTEIKNQVRHKSD